MFYIVRLAVILMVVSGIAAGALALVNIQTRPIIEEYKRLEQERARSEVMKEGMEFVLYDEDSDLPYYRVYSDNEGTELIGYIFTALGKGYSSTIETVTAIDTTFNVVGIKVTSQKETPGLGAKCQEVKYGEDHSWFQRQYFMNYRKQQGASPLSGLTIAVDKDGGDINSITGATITGRAISNSIKESTKILKGRLEGGE